MNVNLQGFDELRRRLESIVNAEEIKVNALETAGEHLRGKIQNSTPVRTGALKAAIVKGEVENNKILIGPSQQGPAFRAHFVEFGTSHSAAKPFMAPTFEQEKTRIEQIIIPHS